MSPRLAPDLSPTSKRHRPHLDAREQALVEAVAQRVVDLLRAGPTEPPVLITAAEVARRRGCSTAWVYRHADELGAIRQGDGPRPRLRFDPAVACSLGRQSSVEDLPAQKPKPRRRRRSRADTSTDLLPIRGRFEAA